MASLGKWDKYSARQTISKPSQSMYVIILCAFFRYYCRKSLFILSCYFFLLFSFPFLFHAAYGYGFLMVTFVSLGSLCGAIIVPLVSTDTKLARIVYEYAYAFMIAVGASALLSDAILHLIPHVSLVFVCVVERTKIHYCSVL